MQSNILRSVDHSYIWGSQVGSQVQWGHSDSNLIFNNIDATKAVLNDTVRAVSFDLISNQSRYMNCPIYHISADGRWGASPNLFKVHFTQKGYGIDNNDILKKIGTKSNNGAPSSDGIYITDLRTKSCRLLVSLARMAQAAGLPLTSPTYGFHVKWSSDGTKLLCVIRTLELPVSSSSADFRFRLSDVRKRSKGARVRVQHLFVIYVGLSPSDSLQSLKRKELKRSEIQYLLSWSSAPFLFRAASSLKPVHLMDGNHPSWVGDTHLVTMNLENKLRAAVDETRGRKTTTKRWSVVVIDTDQNHSSRFPEGAVPAIFALTSWRALLNASDYRTFPSPETVPFLFLQWLLRRSSILFASDAQRVTAVEIHAIGSGHPSVIDGRFLLLDAYAKERALLDAYYPGKLREGTVPLRLVDLVTQKEVWLLQVTAIHLSLFTRQ